MRARIGKCRRRRGQVVYRRAQAGSASHLQAPAETRPARLVARVGRPVSATQMTHQAGHMELTALLTAERGPAQPGPLGGIGTVTGHPYIQLQVHPAAVPCCHGSARDRAEVPEAGHREVDSRLERVPEVGVHRVEPAQHRRRETSLPQGQAFGDASYPEPRRPVLQRRAGRWDAAVPETVGFHHGHHPGLRPGGEEPGVGGDRSQVNGEHRALRAVASGDGGGRHGRAHRATWSRPTGPYTAAVAPVISAQYRSP